MSDKFFKIEEARELIPVLRETLTDANTELSSLAEVIRAAAEEYQAAEDELDTGATASATEELRLRRKRFEQAIEELSNAQQLYVVQFNHWLDTITSYGVVLRDMRDGLLDFPARQNGFIYQLCWRMDEPDITAWHLEKDGFIGRKPLSALLEYC